MTANYEEGQKVKIMALIDSWGRPDPRVQPYVNRTGTVVKAYCITRDEIYEKILKPQDTYCCDVRLDGDGVIVPGIPEVALEPGPSWRG